MSLNSIFVGNTNNLKLIASNPQVTFKQIYILSSVHTSMCVYKPSTDGLSVKEGFNRITQPFCFHNKIENDFNFGHSLHNSFDV